MKQIVDSMVVASMLIANVPGLAGTAFLSISHERQAPDHEPPTPKQPASAITAVIDQP